MLLKLKNPRLWPTHHQAFLVTPLCQGPTFLQVLLLCSGGSVPVSLDGFTAL